MLMIFLKQTFSIQFAYSLETYIYSVWVKHNRVHVCIIIISIAVWGVYSETGIIAFCYCFLCLLFEGQVQFNDFRICSSCHRSRHRCIQAQNTEQSTLKTLSCFKIWKLWRPPGDGQGKKKKITKTVQYCFFQKAL